uniref:Uncharacterized threonine-rich GPI-anchored glycoprotein PJ4664.02-like n=1 Tax=Saccoglossus kowalevskii TaxID=10224 RepID=A0ABM0MND0_SACKO|nr:PREDICTED: uncharacterized threonine-rich GPI-anchored glycoprotein PJ4664.02-like [Saccoglossus kowalevskii]
MAGEPDVEADIDVEQIQDAYDYLSKAKNTVQNAKDKVKNMCCPPTPASIFGGIMASLGVATVVGTITAVTIIFAGTDINNNSTLSTELPLTRFKSTLGSTISHLNMSTMENPITNSSSTLDSTTTASTSTQKSTRNQFSKPTPMTFASTLESTLILTPKSTVTYITPTTYKSTLKSTAMAHLPTTLSSSTLNSTKIQYASTSESTTEILGSTPTTRSLTLSPLVDSTSIQFTTNVKSTYATLFKSTTIPTTPESASSPLTETTESTTNSFTIMDSTKTPLETTMESTTIPITTTMESTTTPTATTMESTTTPIATTIESTTTPIATTMESTTTPIATTIESTTTPITSTMESTTTPITTMKAITIPITTTMTPTTTPITTMEPTTTPIASTMESTTSPFATTMESTTIPITTIQSTSTQFSTPKASTRILTTEFTLTNVALTGTATQSSLYIASAPKYGYAYKAIDGNDDPVWMHESCTHTLNENNAWWKVDLGSLYEIHYVIISNRSLYGERIDGAVVLIGNNTDVSLNEQCGDTIDWAARTDDLKFRFDCILSGQYVGVQLRNRKSSLELCEVEAYGK